MSRSESSTRAGYRAARGNPGREASVDRVGPNTHHDHREDTVLTLIAITLGTLLLAACALAPVALARVGAERTGRRR